MLIYVFFGVVQLSGKIQYRDPYIWIVLGAFNSKLACIPSNIEYFLRLVLKYDRHHLGERSIGIIMIEIEPAFPESFRRRCTGGRTG